jgi:hypothetical protein
VETDLMKLKAAEIKKEYPVTFENLNDNVDVSRAWENNRDYIKFLLKRAQIITS